MDIVKQTFDDDTLSDTIKGVYLLIMMILGGQAAPTFSRQGHTLLKDNYIAKHIIIICLIYFTLDYSQSKVDHPGKTLVITLLIWILYILINRQDFYFTLALFTMVTLLYLLFDFSNYYQDQYKKTHNDEYKRNKLTVDLVIRYLSYSTIIITLVGFVKHYLHQRSQKQRRFNVASFMLGSK